MRYFIIFYAFNHKHLSQVLRGKSKLPLKIRDKGLKWIYKDEQ